MQPFSADPTASGWVAQSACNRTHHSRLWCRVRHEIIRRQIRQVGPVVRSKHLPGVVLRVIGRESMGEPPASSRDVPPETFAHDEEGLQESGHRDRIETRRIDVEMEAERFQEHRSSSVRPCGPQDVDKAIQLRQPINGQRCRDEFPRHERGHPPRQAMRPPSGPASARGLDVVVYARNGDPSRSSCHPDGCR